MNSAEIPSLFTTNYYCSSCWRFCVLVGKRRGGQEIELSDTLLRNCIVSPAPEDILYFFGSVNKTGPGIATYCCIKLY